MKNNKFILLSMAAIIGLFSFSVFSANPDCVKIPKPDLRKVKPLAETACKDDVPPVNGECPVGTSLSE